MIVELLVKAISALIAGLGSLFGTMTLPGWWANVDGWLTTLGGHAAGFGQWIPWATAINTATFVVACIGVAFVIKLVRVVASFFTAGGGSAA